jgi:hypothetical protein
MSTEVEAGGASDDASSRRRSTSGSSPRRGSRIVAMNVQDLTATNQRCGVAIRVRSLRSM